MAKKVTIKPDDTKAALDRLAAKIELLRKARKDAKELEVFIEETEAAIQAQMRKLKATVATVNGVPYFTWRLSNSYAWKQAEDANPELFEKYYEPRVVDVLNKERLLAEHPALLSEFQTRRFEYVD